MWLLAAEKNRCHEEDAAECVFSFRLAHLSVRTGPPWLAAKLLFLFLLLTLLPSPPLWPAHEMLWSWPSHWGREQQVPWLAGPDNIPWESDLSDSSE